MSSRRKRAKARKTATRLAVIIVVFAAILVGLASSRLPRKAVQRDPWPRAQEPLSVQTPLLAAPVPHPHYRYSVVAGGIHDTLEMTTAHLTDPVVRAHYRDMNLKAVRFTRLQQDREAYVSYRVGDAIFWTRQKLHLPRGEEILTDGIHLARVRCGNRISDIPQLPVEPAPAVAKKRDFEQFEPGAILQVGDGLPMPFSGLTQAFGPAEALLVPQASLSRRKVDPGPVQPIPEPSTVWLCLSCLCGIVAKAVITGTVQARRLKCLASQSRRYRIWNGLFPARTRPHL